MRNFIHFNAISRQFETLRKSAKLSCHPNTLKNGPFLFHKLLTSFAFFVLNLRKSQHILIFAKFSQNFRLIRTFSQAKCSFQPYPPAVVRQMSTTLLYNAQWVEERERVSRYPSPGVLVKSWLMGVGEGMYLNFLFFQS
jgi:hypothetical protein